jgi:hypothetical protein
MSKNVLAVVYCGIHSMDIPQQQASAGFLAQ